MWAAYGGIKQLTGSYTHAAVNHQEHFVDPITFACTNTIESIWTKAEKQTLK
jgi:hypothetical protein